MPLDRRAVLASAVAAPLAVGAGALRAETPAAPSRYGLIGKMVAKPGQRDALAAILLAGADDLPGCLSYIVAADAKDADALWVTEVWVSEAAHQASLKLPSVRDAIAKGRPLIASFGDGAETVPLGGHGLN